MTEQAEESRLQVPLDLLRNVSERMLRREIPLTRDRLDGLFAHIQEAVREVLDFAYDSIHDGLDELSAAGETAAENLEEDPEAAAQAQGLVEDFETSREHIDEGLVTLRQFFLAATSFESLEQSQDLLTMAEAQMEEGFARLEQAMLKAEDPSMFNLSPEADSLSAGIALDALAESLEAINSHLETGKRAELEAALRHVEHAREALQRALSDIPAEA